MGYDFAAYKREWNKRNPGRSKELRRDWKLNNPASYLFYKSRTRAQRAGLEYSLTKEWIIQELAKGGCAATGLPFSFDMGTPKQPNPWSPSIDRRDSSKGYTPDNCRIVVWVFNCAKMGWDDEVVLRMAQGLIGETDSGKSIQGVSDNLGS